MIIVLWGKKLLIFIFYVHKTKLYKKKRNTGKVNQYCFEKFVN